MSGVSCNPSRRLRRRLRTIWVTGDSLSKYDQRKFYQEQRPANTLSSRNLVRFGILDHGRLCQRADDAVDLAMVTV
jgi:hypothetical protein